MRTPRKNAPAVMFFASRDGGWREGWKGSGMDGCSEEGRAAPRLLRAPPSPLPPSLNARTPSACTSLPA